MNIEEPKISQPEQSDDIVEEEKEPSLALKNARTIASLRPQEVIKEQTEMTAVESNEAIKKAIETIPDAEIQTQLLRNAQAFKEHGFTDEEVAELIDRMVTDKMLAYTERKPWTKEPLYNKAYVRHRLYKEIDSLFLADGKLGSEDLKKTAVALVDLNGLKALNDIDGHHKGDAALASFINILRKGETISWLNDLGVEVTPFSQEGGDEFGWLLRVKKGRDVNLSEAR